MKALTELQQDVLAFLRAFIEEKGYPPTVREITRGFGWGSTNATCDVLRRLQVKGAIRVEPLVSRGITLVEPRSTGTLTGVSAHGHRFVFVAPVRDVQGGPAYFPPTPQLYTPGGPS